jgi:hypothetical protein
MQIVPVPRTRSVVARHRGVAALAVVAALLCLPAVASAATLPTVTTLPADPTLVTDSYALFSGIVNPNGVNTDYRFDWGTTTAYGQSTPVTNASNGKADVPVDISPDLDLAPATTYHYRLVAFPVAADNVTPTGPAVNGVDVAFTTFPALAVSLVRHKAAVVAGLAHVKLKAVGPPDTTAHGVLSLTTKVKGKRRTLGSVAYRLGVNKSKTFLVKLSPQGRKLFQAGNKRLSVVAWTKTSGIKRIAHDRLTLAR